MISTVKKSAPARFNTHCTHFCGKLNVRHHSRMEKKKLRYLPGIISIVGLPVLLFFWGPRDPVKYTSIPVEMPGKLDRTVNSFAAGDIPGGAGESKKIISIDMNDMIWNEQSAHVFRQKLALVSQQIQYLQFTGDTGTVLKLGLGMKNDYQLLAWVLNEAMLYHLDRQLITADAVYLFPRPVPAVHYTSAALAGQPRLLAAVQTPQRWHSLRQTMQFAFVRLQLQVKYLFVKQQQNRLLAAGFLLLILLPAILKIRWYIKTTGAAYRPPVAAG